MLKSDGMSNKLEDMIREQVREEIYQVAGAELAILKEALGGSPMKAFEMGLAHYTAGQTIQGSNLTATEAYEGAKSVAANIASENYIGAAMDLYSMYTQYKDGVKAPLSGVDAIFGEGIDVRQLDISTLSLGDILRRATFSSRNAGHGLYNMYERSRTGVDNMLGGGSVRDYEDASEDVWVKTSKLNEMAGIPRRTNFNHG